MPEIINTQLGGRELIINSGSVARQASGEVIVQYGETVILATVVIGEKIKESTGMVPLLVNYRERTYAAGKIPGGFFKREGRPTIEEIISSRLIDRSVRPLIPQNFPYEIQITITVLSSDQENDADVPSLIGASCALAISPIPFNGPIGAMRVGKIEGKFVINPFISKLEESSINLIISGKEKEIYMLEGNFNETSEEEIVDAINFGQSYFPELIRIQNELVSRCGKQKINFIDLTKQDLMNKCQELIFGLYFQRFTEILHIVQRDERKLKLNQLKEEILNNSEIKNGFPLTEEELEILIDEIEKKIVRKMVIEENYRLDGRDPDSLRPISCEVGILPRTHGSALFTRGRTQALVTVTLGTSSDMQIMDELEREYKKRFMFHYNFPPFSTGEVKPDRGPGRREIGHGLLSEKALAPIIPDAEQFPYTIRVVSDILESNGSSSMASVCGGTLALMDAGIPIHSGVAGVAMGSIKENDTSIILTDIMGEEDFFGDMDFKIAGTNKGITAIQLDVKLEGGILISTIENTLKKAYQARLKVLDKMSEAIRQPRETISKLAPRIINIEVPIEKIGAIIGPGGKNIRKIMEETGVKSIDIDDKEGVVAVSGDDFDSCERAKKMIEDIIGEIEVGKIYKGKVVRIMDFGAFVEIFPGKSGLVHISQLSPQRVTNVRDVVKEGDEVWVKCIEIDNLKRFNLSIKEALKEINKGNDGK